MPLRVAMPARAVTCRRYGAASAFIVACSAVLTRRYTRPPPPHMGAHHRLIWRPPSRIRPFRVRHRVSSCGRYTPVDMARAPPDARTTRLMRSSWMPRDEAPSDGAVAEAAARARLVVMLLLTCTLSTLGSIGVQAFSSPLRMTHA